MLNFTIDNYFHIVEDTYYFLIPAIGQTYRDGRYSTPSPRPILGLFAIELEDKEISDLFTMIGMMKRAFGIEEGLEALSKHPSFRRVDASEARYAWNKRRDYLAGEAVQVQLK